MSTFRDLQGLMAMSELMIHNIGFDKEDEKYLNSTINRYRTEENASLFDAYTRRVHENKLKYMEVQLLYRIKLLETSEKQFKLSHKSHKELFEYLTRKQIVLMKKLNEVRHMMANHAPLPDGATKYTFRNVNKEIQSYHSYLKSQVSDSAFDQNISTFLVQTIQ